jgi:hypothetical protein
LLLTASGQWPQFSGANMAILVKCSNAACGRQMNVKDQLTGVMKMFKK